MKKLKEKKDEWLPKGPPGDVWWPEFVDSNIHTCIFYVAMKKWKTVQPQSHLQAASKGGQGSKNSARATILQSQPLWKPRNGCFLPSLTFSFCGIGKQGSDVLGQPSLLEAWSGLRRAVGKGSSEGHFRWDGAETTKVVMAWCLSSWTHRLLSWNVIVRVRTWIWSDIDRSEGALTHNRKL